MHEYRNIIFIPHFHLRRFYGDDFSLDICIYKTIKVDKNEFGSSYNWTISIAHCVFHNGVR